jgi:arginine deiminase
MNTSESQLGVWSEAGRLRRVMVCAPGLAHQRLTPENCNELLFDDVLWLQQARRDHFDFVAKMVDRGVEVLETIDSACLRDVRPGQGRVARLSGRLPRRYPGVRAG